MSNLIITIISIALVAVAAIMGIFYGGTAFENGQVQAEANTLLSQAQQVVAADTQYMLDHGFSSFDDFGSNAASAANYSGDIPFLNLAFPAANYSNGLYICDNLNGTPVQILRSHGNFLGMNAVSYFMAALTGLSDCFSNNGDGIDLSQASAATNPLVQICLAINKNASLPPTGLTYTASGLPYDTANTIVSVDGANGNANFFYVNDAAAINFCVLAKPWSGGPLNVLLLVVN